MQEKYDDILMRTGYPDKKGRHKNGAPILPDGISEAD